MKARIAAALAALLFSAISIVPAAAQTTRETDDNGRPAATEGSSRAGAGRSRRGRQPAAPSPEQVMAAAQEQATLGNTNCQVTEAKLLGTTAEQTTVYEMACAAGPGYIIESKTPPVVTDCVILADSAAKMRAADPKADVGPQCTIEANTDTQKFLREYAQQAGVACTVDQVKVLGRASDGGIAYEVGCSDAAGFWIKKLDNAWTKTPCIQVLAENGTCAFTTSAENAALVKSYFAGSDAASCDVTEARLMGRNANGVFYEAKCAAGDGLIARLNTENVVQQVYPCATAQQIGGGCKLTTAPAAAPAPAGGRP
ncbi:MAG: hypothetical protein KJ728_10260 [Alphaproteobacteria bacterium]|uniref:hypothetical protein n=1 Tax=Brevundimonas sp. TaxID=1871086 RepID=UPI001A344405|nr:hypothetical protein [Brevundimonas sp.]MBU1272087.1 hypothetical protein [Alphaproteobacteria bacterium]MBJ7320148.1 hypothetical protein [Brevundimonas sp.]MBU1521792.1 hypothetical protein [Alphaproteobacteria bacterium]MBU2029171.1 hypothetical protein [Alphaproteobacteria bacterium]MBU2165874.1 hypothetical protein [Alphaproteobacteria bacterium]